MNQIARRDWLPELARWSYLTRSGQPGVPRKKKVSRKPYNKSKLVRSRCLDIGLDIFFFFFFLRVYGPQLRLGPQRRKKRTWPISNHLDLTLSQ